MKNLLAKTVYYTRPLENGWTTKIKELVREKIDSGQVSIYQNVSRLGKQIQTQVRYSPKFGVQTIRNLIWLKPDPNQIPTKFQLNIDSFI